MEQIRVCTYDGPGTQPVIRTVPWPKIPKKAALIQVGAWRLRHRFAYPQRSLAEAIAVAVHARP
jgi:hypothetical protein